MMEAIRRTKSLLGLLAAALAMTACGTDADDGGEAAAGPAEEAQDVDASDWDAPASVDIVVHSGPGGGSDVFARQISQMLYDQDFTTNPWPVENVEGGSGATAMAHMMQEGGNDETFAAITMTWIATSITTEGAVDIRELTPIAQVLIEPTFIVAREDAPFDDFDEMIEYAEENPGQLNVSGGSVTSHASIIATLMQEETGTEWRFISFPGGGERISAMLSGDTDIMFGSLQDFEQYIRDGSLKWIASIEEERSDFLDEVPTVRELGYDVEVLEQVRGIVGPPNMSPEAVAGYQEMIREFTETEEWLEYVDENGWTSAYAPADEFGQTIDQLMERLTDILADVDVEEDEA
jgi:putative tricarboxylic transport membrane protein